jgi:hypothetical protein
MWTSTLTNNGGFVHTKPYNTTKHTDVIKNHTENREQRREERENERGAIKKRGGNRSIARAILL